MTTYTVRYSSIDHYHNTRRFKTLEGARKFAVDRIGESPDIGSYYAVSFDGVGKITVDGCTIRELFAGKKAPPPGPYEVWYWNVDEMGSNHRKHKAASFATLAEAEREADDMERYSDGVHIVGATEEAKAAILAKNEAERAKLMAEMEIWEPYKAYRLAGCTCSEMQLSHVGCECEDTSDGR